MQKHCPVPRRRKILVAETKAQYPRFPHYLLRHSGFNVLEAEHGYEALFLARQHPDLEVLIVEADLRFVPGWELACRVRAINPAVKPIVLTSDERLSGSTRDVSWLPVGSDSTTILNAVRALTDSAGHVGTPLKKRIATGYAALQQHAAA